MKIKVVHRSEHPTQEHRIFYPDTPKKEVFDEEPLGTQLPEPEPEPEPDSAIPNSSKDNNLNLVDASNPINSVVPSAQTPSSSLLVFLFALICTSFVLLFACLDLLN